MQQPSNEIENNTIDTSYGPQQLKDSNNSLEGYAPFIEERKVLSVDKILEVTDYKQGDPDWRELKMTGGGLMKDYGCFLTCGAMVLDKTPKEHLEELKHSENDNFYDWSYVADNNDKMVEVRFHFSRDNNFGELKKDIVEHIYENDTPVILMLSRTRNGKKIKRILLLRKELKEN